MESTFENNSLLYETNVLCNLTSCTFIHRFLKNFSGHNSIINCMAINEDNVLVTCGDNGTIQFWDYDTGYCFQKTKTIVQPGKIINSK